MHKYRLCYAASMKLLLLALACASILPAQTNVYVLKAAHLFDGASGQLMTPGMLVVSNGVIQSVGNGNVPAGATVLDLGDATLLPGFIDAHTHLSADFDADYNGAALDFYRNTRATLEGAWLRPRHAGYMRFQHAAAERLRQALESGEPARSVIAAINRLFQEVAA